MIEEQQIQGEIVLSLLLLSLTVHAGQRSCNETMLTMRLINEPSLSEVILFEHHRRKDKKSLHFH